MMADSKPVRVSNYKPEKFLGKVWKTLFSKRVFQRQDQQAEYSLKL